MATPDNRLIFPGVSFGSDKIGPPSPLYVASNSFLYVRALTAVISIPISIHYRIMLPNGVVSPGRFDISIGTARSPVTTGFPLPEGYLLSAAVHLTSGTLLRGQCFIQVGLEQGGAPDFEPIQLLISDYLTTSSVLGWPGGTLRSSLEGPGWLHMVAGTDPPAGQQVVETVPAAARWRLLTFNMEFQTSAVAGNRQVAFVLDNGINVFYEIPAPSTQAANLLWDYYISPGIPNVTILFSVVGIGIADYIMLPAGYRIRTLVGAFDAGDNFAAPVYLVEEWQEL